MVSKNLLNWALGTLIVLSAASQSLSFQEDPRTKVPHIGARTALQLFNEAKLILLDVNPGEGKTRSDIVGAVFIPSAKLPQLRLNAPPGVLLGVFCN